MEGKRIRGPVFKTLFFVTLLTLCLLFLAVFYVYKSPFMPSPLSHLPSVSDTQVGAALNLMIWEQMGNAASNLMNSQCWAASMQMHVVEPLIRETTGGGDQIFFFSSDYQNAERFRDLFDITRWNEYSMQHGYAPLMSVEEFLEKASRNLIYVQVQYSTSKCQKPRRTLQPLLFLNSLGFTTVREVCLNLLHKGRLRTQQELTELIFGDLLGHGNFTVVFSEWRAIRNEFESEGKLSNIKPGASWYRILVKDSPCSYNCINHQPYYKTWLPAKRNVSLEGNKLVDPEFNSTALKNGKVGFIPSDKVLADTAKYRTKFMNNQPYIAIMMRMENLHQGIATDSSYASCLDKAKSLWTTATQKYGISQTFITSDMGKYGSYSWSSNQVSTRFQEDIVKMVGMSSSFVDTLNKNIEEVTSSTGRVKMAWTQSIMVAEARCIIFLGGGSLQGLILNIHSALYLGRECFVYTDTHCNQYAKLGFE